MAFLRFQQAINVTAAGPPICFRLPGCDSGFGSASASGDDCPEEWAIQEQAITFPAGTRFGKEFTLPATLGCHNVQVKYRLLTLPPGALAGPAQCLSNPTDCCAQVFGFPVPCYGVVPGFIVWLHYPDPPSYVYNPQFLCYTVHCPTIPWLNGQSHPPAPIGANVTLAIFSPSGSIVGDSSLCQLGVAIACCPINTAPVFGNFPGILALSLQLRIGSSPFLTCSVTPPIPGFGPAVEILGLGISPSACPPLAIPANGPFTGPAADFWSTQSVRVLSASPLLLALNTTIQLYAGFGDTGGEDIWFPIPVGSTVFCPNEVGLCGTNLSLPARFPMTIFVTEQPCPGP